MALKTREFSLVLSYSTAGRAMQHRKRILLLSSSSVYGSGYFDYAESEIRDFFDQVERILFVPFARHDQDDYAAQTRERLGRMSYNVDSLHLAADPRGAVQSAQAILVGGGNTFRLLKRLYDNDLLSVIRERAHE